MEIGISSEQLIDIGLNMAGFITAGLLIMLLISLFKRKKPVSKKNIEAKSLTKAEEVTQPSDIHRIEPEPGIEFVNLKGVDWNPRQFDGKKNEELNNRMKDRQDIVQLAAAMLSGKNLDGGKKKSIPMTNGEVAFTKQNLIMQPAGRNG